MSKFTFSELSFFNLLSSSTESRSSSKSAIFIKVRNRWTLLKANIHPYRYVKIASTEYLEVERQGGGWPLHLSDDLIRHYPVRDKILSDKEMDSWIEEMKRENPEIQNIPTNYLVWNI